jgi:hypothetical protein
MGPSKDVEVTNDFPTHITAFEFVYYDLIIKHLVWKFKSHPALMIEGIAIKSLLKKLIVT